MLIDNLHREAHVCFAIPEAVQDEAILQRLAATLSDEELDKYRRFHFPEDRHHYLVSHALLRMTLSEYADLSPVDWRFSRNEHGRPEIANPDMPPLRFNLTHTDGLVGCIVTLDNDCGIDAEKVTARHATPGIAKRMFSEAEYRELLQLEGHDSLEYFFTHWTLREAYVKARGIGIFFPTHKLTFTVTDRHSVAVSFHPDIGNRQEHWYFRLLDLSDAHVTAIALNSATTVSKNIVVRHCDFQAALA